MHGPTPVRLYQRSLDISPVLEKCLFWRWAEHLEDQEVGTLIKGGTDRHMLDLTASSLIDSDLEEMPL